MVSLRKAVKLVSRLACSLGIRFGVWVYCEFLGEKT